MKAKQRQNNGYQRSKFHKNDNFDFLTGGQEIKFDEWLSTSILAIPH